MKPNLVQSRFDQETEQWNTYHQEGQRTIVHREIVLRKRETLRVLKERFAGQEIRILEIGCGTGENLQAMVSSDPAWKGVGVDISPKMIETCQEKFKDSEQLSFSVLNIEERALDTSFDVIVLLGVVGYFADTKRAFTHMCSMLKPGGILMFTYGNKHSIFRIVRWLFSRWSFVWPTYVLGSLMRRLLGKSRVVYRKERSHFVSIQPSKIRELVGACGAQVIEEQGLLYASGICGRLSVWFSRLVERFVKQDRLDQAFTKFMVVQK